MTKTEIFNECEFAAKCMIEKFDEMLSAGEITKQRHDELVAKVKGA